MLVNIEFQPKLYIFQLLEAKHIADKVSTQFFILFQKAFIVNLLNTTLSKEPQVNHNFQ